MSPEGRMIFPTAKSDLGLPFVLVLALLLVTNVFNDCGPAQELEPTAIASQERLPATEGEPEVIRSIAALREYQPSDSQKALKVDLEAQLIFAAPYWTVFFIQDGDCNAMVWCTDANFVGVGQLQGWLQASHPGYHRADCWGNRAVFVRSYGAQRVDRAN